ncbi:type III secretion system protein SctP [Xanthomonas sp. NCPPB 1638]|uniref:type III secretion system protein SctP n=1 Tax=Xanthomonas TaxID=338 RepID=UPI00132F16BB|nr:type III secretion system protein SctP [Xanthomonas cucurbitae]QHG88379.1 type III secretion protein [Xanthomonas cucurbitae]WDM74946.1 type III secretion system protein SctP [Xanthomonas cucurbitae]
MRKLPMRPVRILSTPAMTVTPLPLRQAQRVQFLQLRRRPHPGRIAEPDMPGGEMNGLQTRDDIIGIAACEPSAEDIVQATPPHVDQYGAHQQDEGRECLDQRIAAEFVRTQCAQMSIDSIALHVADFCNSQPVRDAGIWEATLPIRQDMIGKTTLFLRLSPDQLLLRFDSSSPDARELLWSGREQLRVALKAALSNVHEIRIEVI